LYNKIGKYDEAIADFNKALELPTGNSSPILYNNRGCAYVALGQYNKALVDFKKATEIDPNFAVAYLGEGISFENLGRKKEAIEAYKNFIKYAPPGNEQLIKKTKAKLRELK